jgi:hypothetical protein
MSAIKKWSYKNLSRTCRTPMSHFMLSARPRRLVGWEIYAYWICQ